MASIEDNTPDRHAPGPRRDWALFLDIDGTLIDIAPTPEAVKIPATLAPTLVDAARYLDGALAIVSGRTLTKIDELMAPLTLPCAGEHGAIIRLPDGTLKTPRPVSAVPDTWKNCVRDAAKAWNGVVVEYKPYSIAAHFRLAPEYQQQVHDLFLSIVREDEQEYEILPARMAFEIRNRGLTKAAAVDELMLHAPFRGRTPVFVGDDVTDEDGFRAARERGGLGLHVKDTFGGHTSEVRRWLETFRPAMVG